MNEARARRKGEYSTERKRGPGRPKKVIPDYPPGVSVGELSPLFDFSRKPWLLLQATLRQLVTAYTVLEWTHTRYQWTNAKLTQGYRLHVLDAACGYGELYTLLRDYRKVKGVQLDYLGVDLDREKLEVARLLRPNIDVREMNVLDIERLPQAPFNVVVSGETLEHLEQEDGKRFILSMVNVLEPGGILVLTSQSPEHGAKKRQYHLYEWPREEVLDFTSFLPLRLLDEFPVLLLQKHWLESMSELTKRVPADMVRPVAAAMMSGLEGSSNLFVFEKQYIGGW